MGKLRDLMGWLSALKNGRRPKLHFIVADFNHKNGETAEGLRDQVIRLGRATDVDADVVVLAEAPPFPIHVKLRLDTLSEKECEALMRTFVREAVMHGCREVYESVELAR